MSIPRIKRPEFEDLLKKTVKLGGGKFLPYKMKKIVRGMYMKNSSLTTAGMSRVTAMKKLNQAIAAGKEAGVKFKYQPATKLGVRRAVREKIEDLEIGDQPEEGFIQKEEKDMTAGEKRKARVIKSRNLKIKGDEIAAEKQAEQDDKDTPRREALDRQATVFGSRGKVQVSALEGKTNKPVASIGQPAGQQTSPAEPIDLPID